MAKIKKKVLILGAGPSAAFAVRACLDSDVRPVVRAKSISPAPPGLFMLLWLPESVMTTSERLQYSIRSSGSPEIYWQKRWRTTSHSVRLPRWGEKIIRGFRGNDGLLQQLWGDVVPDTGFQYTDEQLLELADSDEFNLIVQTFPTQFHSKLYREFLLQYPVATFRLEDWFQTRESESFKMAWDSDLCFEDVRVLYNGLENDSWFRATADPLSGTVAVEYQLMSDEKLEGAIESGFNRAIHPDMPQVFANMHPKILLTGKWATWNKDEASHWTYGRVYGEINVHSTR